MPKGQFSRVPRPGNSWIRSLSSLLFGHFSSPTNINSHSLQLATQTELAHHYIQYALSTLSAVLFFKSKKILQSTAWPHPSTARPLERATGHMKVTHSLIDSCCRHGKNVNRSMNLVSNMSVTSSH